MKFDAITKFIVSLQTAIKGDSIYSIESPSEMLDAVYPLRSSVRNLGISMQEAADALAVMTGYTKPYQLLPSYEAMLLNAGYTAELRCEAPLHNSS